jgi:hypothetical protein
MKALRPGTPEPEGFNLDGIGVLSEFGEVPPAVGGEGDDVAAPVDSVVALEAVDDAV